MAGGLPEELRRVLDQEADQNIGAELWDPVGFNDWYNLREGGISGETFAAASQLTVYDAKQAADPKLVEANRRAFDKAYGAIPGIDACLLAAGINRKTLTPEQWENLPVDFAVAQGGELTPLTRASGVWRQFVDYCDHQPVNH